MLTPKRTKFKKYHRGRLKGKASRGNKINFGDYAIQSIEPGWITSRQIEATRRVISRKTKRNGKLWIMIFPDKPITARAAESRMGSGKGAVDYWVAVVKPGTILFELDGINPTLARKVLTSASHKLPVKTKVLFKTIDN